MATQLDICNAALIKLGQEPISALSDNNKRARLVNTNYDRIKKKLLRRHNWGFAKKRDELTATGNTPEYEYTHEFALPSDFVRIVNIQEPEYEHSIEGGKLLYNGGSTIKLTYICDADESLFDSLFTDLLAATLADEICLALTQSQNLKQQVAQELELLLGETRSINAQTRGTPQDVEADDLIFSRL